MIMLLLAQNIEAQEYWHSTPTVSICESFEHKSCVFSAISYWKEYGFDIGKTERDNCQGKFQDNKIYFVGYEDFSEREVETLALTRTYYEDDIIYYSTVSLDIRYKKDSLNCDIVIHEMGHALGLNHSNNPFSIMYKDAIDIQNKVFILEEHKEYFRK